MNSFSSFSVGDQFIGYCYISVSGVHAFGYVTGYLYLLHVEKEYAPKTFIGKRIVHGSYLLGLISKVLVMDFSWTGYRRNFTGIIL